MNLVDDAWIPVVGIDGKSELRSLADVFRDGDEIADLSVNPCQRVALMRLLICIAQAALDGPADEEDWRNCRERMADKALTYLDAWRERFNLFGDGAFLQVDGLDKSTNALSDKLDFSLAAGNNPTLFDHGASPGGRSMSASLLALNLIVYQMFSPGGLVGIVTWNGQPTSKTSEHAPCLEGSMLHTYLRGDVLIDSIHMNLLSKDCVSAVLGSEWGRPSWEIEAKTCVEVSSVANTYLGRLVPIARCIRLNYNQAAITLGDGIRYRKLPEYREPMATVRKIKRGRDEALAYLPVDPAKHAWRELGAILAMQDVDAKGGALCFDHLRGTQKKTIDVWVGGIAADKAKLLDMCEWNFALPTELLDTRKLNAYVQGVNLAETARRTLYVAIKTYAQFVNSDAIWLQDAQRFFWGELDRRCTLLVQSVLDDLGSESEWRETVRSAMREAYERTCPHGTPRQIEAYAQGLKILDGWRAEIQGGHA